MKITDVEDTSLVVAAQAFAALGSEQRLGVLRVLVRSGPEGLSVGELSAKTGITGANMTHHIRVLNQAGLVMQAKSGRSVICAAVAYDTVRELADFLLSECCADAENSDHKHGSDE